MSELMDAEKVSHPGRLSVWHDTVIAAQSKLMVPDHMSMLKQTVVADW